MRGRWLEAEVGRVGSRVLLSSFPRRGWSLQEGGARWFAPASSSWPLSSAEDGAEARRGKEQLVVVWWHERRVVPAGALAARAPRQPWLWPLPLNHTQARTTRAPERLCHVNRKPDSRRHRAGCFPAVVLCLLPPPLIPGRSPPDRLHCRRRDGTDPDPALARRLPVARCGQESSQGTSCPGVHISGHERADHHHSLACSSQTLLGSGTQAAFAIQAYIDSQPRFAPKPIPSLPASPPQKKKGQSVKSALKSVAPRQVVDWSAESSGTVYQKHKDDDGLIWGSGSGSGTSQAHSRATSGRTTPLPISGQATIKQAHAKKGGLTSDLLGGGAGPSTSGRKEKLRPPQSAEVQRLETLIGDVEASGEDGTELRKRALKKNKGGCFCMGALSHRPRSATETTG